MARRGEDSKAPVRPEIAKENESSKGSDADKVHVLKGGETGEDIVWWRPKKGIPG